MKKEYQKFAKYALILSGIAAVITIILYVILNKFSLPVQISLAVFVVGLAAYGSLNPLAVKQILYGRQAKYGSNALILTLAFLGILIVINLIAYNNTVRWDLTEDKTNTLADETLNVLKSLDDEVNVQAFFSSLISRENAENLLMNYKANSNGNFVYEFIDPNENPIVASSAGITRDGSIVVRSGEIKEIVTSITEEQLTSALIRIKSPEKKIIYALTGHGEASFTSSSDISYSYAVSELVSKNYTVNELNLMATNAIPDDATVIIIAGPLKPLSLNEVELIEAFVNQGGSLLIMYEPRIMTQFNELEDPLEIYLSEAWNFSFGNDMVIDLTANPITTAVAASYGTHAITNKLEGMVSIFLTSRSIVLGSNQTKIPSILASTSSQSWAETDFEALLNDEVTFDGTLDIAGPLTLAVAVEDSNIGSRVVAIGDSEFANDIYYAYYGNADLFLNAVDWVSGLDEIISLTARTKTTRTLVTPNRYVQNAILLSVVILIPSLIIVAAIIVFVKRHREV